MAWLLYFSAPFLLSPCGDWNHAAHREQDLRFSTRHRRCRILILSSLPSYRVKWPTPNYDAGKRSLRSPPGSGIVFVHTWNTWREQIVCPADKLVPVPDGLDDSDAAASYINPLTAWALTARFDHSPKNRKLFPADRIVSHVDSSASSLSKNAHHQIVFFRCDHDICSRIPKCVDLL